VRLEVLCFSRPAVWQVFIKSPTIFSKFLWDGSEESLTLVPYYKMAREHYNMYWKNA
jgi:hypothetical protein